MAQASSADNYIFEGVWINWSRGSVFGLTLTVSPSHAAILSPALAVLISIAGSQLWHLTQYALHQLRATPDARPMIYHQIQVLLRTSSTDIDTLWRLIRIGIAWRQLLPIIALAIWALLHFALVLTFGLFSSWLLQSNNEVLSRSPWCGSLNTTYGKIVYSRNYTDPYSMKLYTEWTQYMYSRWASTQQHVDICTNSSGSCNTNTYRPDKLNSTNSFIANQCPFGSSACHPDSETMFLDTGFLSSHSDLGLNAAEEDRVSFRTLAKCAPLNTAQFSTTWHNASTPSGVKELADAEYGVSAYNDRNSTYTIWQTPMDCEQRRTLPPYTLASYWAVPGGNLTNKWATFNPIPDLETADSDLSLVLLMSNDAYKDPVKDPWYSAEQAYNGTSAFCGHTNDTAYVREYPITAMACTQQWQICNADKGSIGHGSCNPLLSRAQTWEFLISPTSNIAFTDRQYATMERIIGASSGASYYYLVLALSQAGTMPLKARAQARSVAGALSADLPSDQWQTEVNYWTEMVLAQFQQNSLDLSTGQFVASTSYINVTKPSVNHEDPIEDARYWLCQSQIIQSEAYRNFNLFALLITSILSVFIIILGLCIDDCVGCFRQRRMKYSGPPGRGKQDMWVANSDLHMLRAIDEVRNQTSWTLSANGIPRTHPSYEVSLTDLAAEGHEVEEGKGIVVSAVRRMQSAKANNNNSPLSHPSPHNPGTFVLLAQSEEGYNTSFFSSDAHTPNSKYSPHGFEPKRVPTVVVTEEFRDSSDTLTFSNSLDLTSDTANSRPYNTDLWPWLKFSSMPKNNVYNDSASESEGLELRTTRPLRHVKGSVNRST